MARNKQLTKYVKYCEFSKNYGDGRVNLVCYEPNLSSIAGTCMKIEQIEITDIGGIPHLKLENLHPQMNIICGENGVGKTNILDSIAYVFTYESYSNQLRKRVGSEEGVAALNIKEDNGNKRYIKSKISIYEPDENNMPGYSQEILENKSYLLYLRVNRVFDYKKVEAIRSDPKESDYSKANIKGVNIGDLKEWFVSRVLHSANKSLATEQNENIQLAKTLFSKLDDDFSYHNINTKNEIEVNSPTGLIYFDYLSSGFKSAFFILLGIIKEIEYRLQKNKITASNFQGIILIDEIELHFHPEWQRKIGEVLVEVFPKAQFFITTHSPHVVQSAKQGQVIALEKEKDEQGKVRNIIVRDLPEANKYGFQGWTIEEILTDVMGMGGTNSIEHENAMRRFDAALDENNKLEAQEAYDVLDKMLHPSSHVKKLLRIQMAGLE